MKIEVAPWIREYVVDMEELYSELTLEKIQNKPTGTFKSKIHNYKELLGEIDVSSLSTSERIFRPALENSALLFSQTMLQWVRGIKIKTVLLKGDPGIGKSTLCKKIAWDWAKGIYDTFVVVFVVFLKFVRPGETIESSIIAQYPS